MRFSRDKFTIYQISMIAASLQKYLTAFLTITFIVKKSSIIDVWSSPDYTSGFRSWEKILPVTLPNLSNHYFPRKHYNRTIISSSGMSWLLPSGLQKSYVKNLWAIAERYIFFYYWRSFFRDLPQFVVINKRLHRNDSFHKQIIWDSILEWPKSCVSKNFTLLLAP